MSDEIEIVTKKRIVETRTLTRTLPHLKLNVMPRKSTALARYMTVSQRIVNGKPEAVAVALSVRRVRRDGVEAQNAVTIFYVGQWSGKYDMRENFTAETIERIEQAARETLSEFEAVDWESA